MYTGAWDVLGLTEACRTSSSWCSSKTRWRASSRLKTSVSRQCKSGNWTLLSRVSLHVTMQLPKKIGRIEEQRSMPGLMPRAQSTCGWVRDAVQMSMVHRARGLGPKGRSVGAGGKGSGRRVAQVS